MASQDGSPINENDVAIVGMAARLPGAWTVDRYWQNLRDGLESVRRYTREELLEAGETAAALDDPAYVPAGAPLDGVELFDGEFFGFSPKESAILDPQHRHFLEVAWEALEDAGHPPGRFEGSIGVFGGVGMGAYFALNLLTNPDLVESVGLFLLRHTGNDKDFLVTRVSYLLDLKGPAVNVQTACSTSLVAAHMGVQALLSGECDMALAGGVTLEIPHRRGYHYKEGEVLSPDGHCHAFDHRGQGTVFGSGAGVVVLRRAEDALADGDHIHAIIKGSAINNDGASKVGYLAPSVDGQAAAMAEAYEIAGITADTIDYVECHGTGTYMGDPIEVSGLTQAFRKTTDKKQFCRIGSVKTNIGHLDTAAGVASLIKASMALQHGEIPPSLGFEKPNPNIDFENSPFVVNDRLWPWPERSHPRRVAVNSLGVGGTNAHVVLQQGPPQKPSIPSARPWQLLMLSGRTRKAVDGNAQRLAAHLEDHPELDLADVAYTLQVGRRRFEQRRVVAARTTEEAARLLRENDRQRVYTHAKVSDNPSCVFLMPGGGAQYPGMARGLYETEPVFKEHMDRGLEILERTKGVDLRPLLLDAPDRRDPEAAATELAAMHRQLPAIFIVSFAMAKLLESWDVTPDALLGHSLGENTAACLAGVFDYEEALGLVALRGELFNRLQGGGISTVQMAIDELEPIVERHGLDLAGENAPGLCLVSGPVEALTALEAELAGRGVESARIPVPVAAHSRLLEPILQEFGDYLRSMTLRPPQVRLMSNLTGDWMTDEQATDPDYWVRHLRSTVRFAGNVGRLLTDEDRVYVEVGPGRILSSLVRQHPRAAANLSAIPTTRHPDHDIDDAAWFQTALGRLAAAGLAVDLERPFQGEQRRKVRLPTYAFQHSKYWIEPGAGAAAVEDLSRLPRFEHLDQFFHRPVWVGAPLDDAIEGERHTWLVFQDPIGISEQLVTRLRHRGDTVVTVDVGDAYHREGDHFTLAPEQGRESYDLLIHDLVASGITPNRIVHMWLATSDARVRMGSSAFHTHTQYGFYSLLFLLQAVADEGLPGPIHLTTFTTGARQVAEESVPFFEKSLVAGPTKVGPREVEGLSASWVDLEAPTRPTLLEVLPIEKVQRLARRPHYDTLDGLVDIVEAEVLAPDVYGSFAWREGQRFQETFRPARVAENGKPAFEKGGCYLITGGLGGLGLTFARHLAERYHAKLILTGRTGLPPRDGWDEWLQTHGADDRTSRRILEVRRLEQLGAEAMVEELDVTDVETLREIVERAEERWGRVNGVLHAAGVVADELLQLKTQLGVEDVFGPKVHGTLVLASVFEERPLDLMVLFSSSSTILAPPGQVDYVAANEFLNAFAQRQRTRGKAVFAVDWGVWNEVGLAADALQRALRGADDDAPSRTPTTHPLLDAKLDKEKGASVLTTLLSTNAHWLLDQHRTKGGHALVPGTGYLELARAAADAFGHHRALEIRNLFFFRPLAVEDGEAKEMQIRLHREVEGYEMEVRSKRQVDGVDGWELHAQASLLLGGLSAPEDLDLSAIEARMTGESVETPEGSAGDQSQNLAFGDRWFNLREIRYGDGEAIARLELPPAHAGEVDDYGLHPALLDIATGFAMRLIEGYDPSRLWVPVSYDRVRVHRPMPSAVRSWVVNAGDNRQDRDVASFDVIIADEEGRVSVEITGFTIKRIDGSVDFAVTSTPSRGEFEPERTARGQLSPAEEQLLRNTERGILPAEGTEALERVLSDRRRPVVVVSSMPLEKLIEQQDRMTLESTESSGQKFDRPDLDSEYVEPRDDIERTVVSFWEELLGVNQVGVQDSFFDLGGHSLIAVRLFAKIKQTYSVDYPISVLFEAPTIERCAEMIREALGDTVDASSEDAPPREKKPVDRAGPRYLHLVPMHKGEGGPKRPFFMVAGMFGNVLNLGHLANLIGADRPFYGLQARGLFGDVEPHETFEEAARDYIEEMRQVQPHGPYLIGGFSGGGLTAWEIARQLEAAGEEVAMLLLLDSRLPKMPPLTYQDRVRMKAQELSRSGPAYLVEWGKNRFEWELGKIRRRFFPAEAEEGPSPTSFQNEAVEAAFRRALERYEMPYYQGTAILFRPKLDPTYVLDDNRWVDHEYEYMFHDNGFGKHCRDLEVYEVPGDHDSMVLEPNVRVMARRLRRCIERAELEVEYRERGLEPPPRDPKEVELAHRVRGPKDFTAA